MGVSFGDGQAARQRIREFIYCSPAPHSAALSQMTGQQVFLKLDNLQRTGAFKERGALNKILTLTDDEKRRGVIAASAQWRSVWHESGNNADGIVGTSKGVLVAQQDSSDVVLVNAAGHATVARQMQAARRTQGADSKPVFCRDTKRSAGRNCRPWARP